MASGADPQKNLATAYGAVFFVGAFSVIVGLVAVLFEVRFLQNLGLGWSSILFGIVFLVLGYYVKQGAMIALAIAIGLYSLDGIVFLVDLIQRKGSPATGGIIFRLIMLWFMSRGFGAIRELKANTTRNIRNSVPSAPAPSAPAVSLAVPTTASGPRPVSFVAPTTPIVQPETPRGEVLSKSITPEILNLRYVAYRCEIFQDHLKAVYQNASQKELKWFEVGAIVFRQFPFQPPWDGKLLLDIVPLNVAGEKIQPLRILSSTFINYGFLPQGQSASTKENMRRMANFILSQNRSIYVDPGTDSFIQAGQPPVRFLSMSQFTEYDSRYG